MKSASKTSNTLNDRERDRWIEFFAPPRPRRRVREARRWNDELFAATLNGPLSLRWPGQRLFSLDEGHEIRERAIAELKERNPELFKAREYVIFWDNLANDFDSLEQYKRQAARRAVRMAKIRLAMRPREFK